MRRDTREREEKARNRLARSAWRDAVRTLPGRIADAERALSVAKARLGEPHADVEAEALVKALGVALARAQQDLGSDAEHRRASVRSSRARGVEGRAQFRRDLKDPVAALRRWARIGDPDTREFARASLLRKGIDPDAAEPRERAKRGRPKCGLREQVREALQLAPGRRLTLTALARQVGRLRAAVSKAANDVVRRGPRHFGRDDGDDEAIYFAR